ncbi:hypothetical protein [Snodgrassella communis]|nr:hypothetical protein [Snodgrassella communis]
MKSCTLNLLFDYVTDSSQLSAGFFIGAFMLKLDVDLSELNNQLDGISDRVQKNLRRAVYEGAVLIRDEAIKLAGVSKKPHIFRSGRLDRDTGKMVWDGSPYEFNPGDLKKSIYIAFAKDKSIEGERVEYDISFRKNTSYGVQGQSVPYAYWQELGRAIEYGGPKVIAHPFLRPAFDKKRLQTRALITKALQDAANGKTANNGD